VTKGSWNEIPEVSVESHNYSVFISVLSFTTQDPEQKTSLFMGVIIKMGGDARQSNPMKRPNYLTRNLDA
jgi:hypothetical protein